MGCRFDSAGGAAAPVSALTSGSASVGGGKSDRRVTLATIKEESLGTNSTNAWVQVRALHSLPFLSSMQLLLDAAADVSALRVAFGSTWQ